MARQISATDFDNEIAKAGSLPAVVDFTATWCGPCQSLAPHIDSLATDFNGKVNVVKVDVDQEPDLAARFHVMGVPAILFFKDGAKVDQVVGNHPKEIRAKTEALIG